MEMVSKSTHAKRPQRAATGRRTSRAHAAGNGKNGPQVRYAVVGLGYIAQSAVLPAFAHAESNSVLTTLISDDAVKLRQLSRKYRVQHTFSYADYADCLIGDFFDAVYIALPNHLHREYAEQAAAAGVHVLCEKPMAIHAEDCESMIRRAQENDVRLMVAYRLHYEPANLTAIQLAHSGKLGDPRIFNSVFTMNVRSGDIRLQEETGGGTLHDIGIYCINAARHLFGEEPVEVFATTSSHSDPRFEEVDEMTCAVLRFPHGQIASFTTSFGAADVSRYELVGTKGSLRLDPAYSFSTDLTLEATINGRTQKKSFASRDQFAPELIAFSAAVISRTDPEPSGEEGLRDVKIINALERSAKIQKPMHWQPVDPPPSPGPDQAMYRPPVEKRELVHAKPPSR
jgi:predicted dehydrogenase